MSPLDETLRKILSAVDRFLNSTLQNVNLGKSAEKEKKKIAGLLQKLYSEHEHLNPSNADVGSSSSSKSKDGAQSIPNTTVDLLTNPLKAGYLQKKTDGGRFLNPKRKCYYCVVHKNIMYWFKKKEDKRQHGAFLVTGYEFREIPPSAKDIVQKEFPFEVICTGKTSFQFVVDSTEELENWRQAVATANKYIVTNAASGNTSENVCKDEEGLYEPIGKFTVKDKKPNPKAVPHLPQRKNEVPELSDFDQPIEDECCDEYLVPESEQPTFALQSPTRNAKLPPIPHHGSPCDEVDYSDEYSEAAATLASGNGLDVEDEYSDPSDQAPIESKKILNPPNPKPLPDLPKEQYHVPELNDFDQPIEDEGSEVYLVPESEKPNFSPPPPTRNAELTPIPQLGNTVDGDAYLDEYSDAITPVISGKGLEEIDDYYEPLKEITDKVKDMQNRPLPKALPTLPKEQYHVSELDDFDQPIEDEGSETYLVPESEKTTFSQPPPTPNAELPPIPHLRSPVDEDAYLAEYSDAIMPAISGNGLGREDDYYEPLKEITEKVKKIQNQPGPKPLPDLPVNVKVKDETSPLPSPRFLLPSQKPMKDSTPVPARKRVLALGIINFKGDDYENMYYGIWKCTGPTDNELSFDRGDMIHVINKELDAENWWVGELKGQIGLVPKPFLCKAYEIVA